MLDANGQSRVYVYARERADIAGVLTSMRRGALPPTSRSCRSCWDMGIFQHDWEVRTDEKAYYGPCSREMTAYLSPSPISELRAVAPNASSILLRNWYGWFTRIERGLYELTPEGAVALDLEPKGWCVDTSRVELGEVVGANMPVP